MLLAPTFEEGDNVEKIDMKHRPSAEYRYWLYDPEGDGMVYFRTPAERDKQAARAIDAYLDDGWADEVELVAAGELTHFAQVTDKRMRPADEDLDDEMRDSEGIEWPVPKQNSPFPILIEPWPLPQWASPTSGRTLVSMSRSR